MLDNNIPRSIPVPKQRKVKQFLYRPGEALMVPGG
jgi:hypothetical protein